MSTRTCAPKRAATSCLRVEQSRVTFHLVVAYPQLLEGSDKEPIEIEIHVVEPGDCAFAFRVLFVGVPDVPMPSHLLISSHQLHQQPVSSPPAPTSTSFQATSTTTPPGPPFHHQHFRNARTSNCTCVSSFIIIVYHPRRVYEQSYMRFHFLFSFFKIVIPSEMRVQTIEQMHHK